ncbi:MAG: cytidine deaminase [Rhodothermia bacterium]|nr:cytidine deaminase [Rhodothermia bacterium]
MPESPVSSLSALLTPFRHRSRSPYSKKPDAAAVLLTDGTWVPGVRVETASFSLAIGAPLNAVTTAVAAGRTDIAAVILLSPASESQTAYLEELPFTSLRLRDHLTFVSADVTDLPKATNLLNPFLDISGSTEVTNLTDKSHSANTAAPETQHTPGIHLARRALGHAFAPLSRFPVGCILELNDGRLLPGVNVEHPDWNHILCAERNALGTAVTYGCDHLITSLYLSCKRDPDGTPCGACRQVITELAPGSEIVMDRGNRTPDTSSPDALLPGSFTGNAILGSPDQQA